MKRFKFCLSTISMIILLSSLFSCGKYNEGAGLGTVTIIQKGAFIRTAGGGVQDKELWPGTNLVTTTGTGYTAINKCFTPRTITLKKLPVIMTNMKNQQLTFSPSLTYMVIPGKMPLLFKDFKSSTQEITTIFTQSCLEVLGKLEMGLEMIGGKKNKADGLSFDNREIVSANILKRFLENFKTQYPEYLSCFIFMDAATGNVDFNKEVLTKLEEAVAKEYESERLIIESQSEDLRGQIQVARSKADLEAYGKESGALDDDVLAYLSLKLVDKFTSNDHINTKIIIPLDKDGNIAWLKADNKKR